MCSSARPLDKKVWSFLPSNATIGALADWMSSSAWPNILPQPSPTPSSRPVIFCARLAASIISLPVMQAGEMCSVPLQVFAHDACRAHCVARAHAAACWLFGRLRRRAHSGGCAIMGDQVGHSPVRIGQSPARGLLDPPPPRSRSERTRRCRAHVRLSYTAKSSAPPLSGRATSSSTSVPRSVALGRLRIRTYSLYYAEL